MWSREKTSRETGLGDGPSDILSSADTRLRANLGMPQPRTHSTQGHARQVSSAPTTVLAASSLHSLRWLCRRDGSIPVATLPRYKLAVLAMA